MRYVAQVALAFLAFALIALSIWAYWAGHSDLIFTWWGKTGHESAGSWGDAFGGFNALFSALAFSAVVATLIVQMRASIDQQRDQHRQRFDVTFFEMLKTIRELKSELRFKHSNDFMALQAAPATKYKTQKGREAITEAMGEMTFWIGKLRRSASLTESEIVGHYMKYVHGRYESRFGPYFRMVYTILNRIKSDTVLSEEEKSHYGNIVRSQLNRHEAAFIAINALAPIAGNLRSLVVRFRLLKYIPKGRVRSALESNFDKETFLARD